MPRLTKRVVDALRVPNGKDEATAWCSDLKGFGARIRPSGAVTFVFKHRLGRGRAAPTRRAVIGRYGPLTVDQARAIAQKMAANVANGAEPSPRKKAHPDDRLTVNDLLDRWEQEAARRNSRTGQLRKPHNVAADIGRLNAHIRPTLGKGRLSDLTPEVVERTRDAIASGATAKRTPSSKPRGVIRVRGGDGTATRTLRLFASVCEFGVRRRLLQSNPCRGVPLTPARPKRRVLSDGELRALGAGLKRARELDVSPSAIAQVRVLLATGARRNEVAAMRWSEIDLALGVWRPDDTKTGPSTRPLSSVATDLLARQPRQCGSDYVFPAVRSGAYYTGLKRAWPRIRALSGLSSDVTLHTLRHTFATLGALENFPTALLKAVLGHHSESTTLGYQHMAHQPAQAAASAVARRIAERIGRDDE